MIAHTHHYVPQWLQRRFRVNQNRYFYRDLAPERFTKPDGTHYTRRATNRWGPQKCFASEDLYAVNFPGHQSDVVEKEFFGIVDDQAAKSIDFFVTGEFPLQNHYYMWFLRYLSIQKMRTPKGLAWLRLFGSDAFGPLRTPEELMITLSQIGEMHVTSWAESVWEVVEASAPDVGFILTDHPVTVYNLKGTRAVDMRDTQQSHLSSFWFHAQSSRLMSDTVLFCRIKNLWRSPVIPDV